MRGFRPSVKLLSELFVQEGDGYNNTSTYSFSDPVVNFTDVLNEVCIRDNHFSTNHTQHCSTDPDDHWELVHQTRQVFSTVDNDWDAQHDTSDCVHSRVCTSARSSTCYSHYVVQREHEVSYDDSPNSAPNRRFLCNFWVFFMTGQERVANPDQVSTSEQLQEWNTQQEGRKHQQYSSESNGTSSTQKDCLTTYSYSERSTCQSDYDCVIQTQQQVNHHNLEDRSPVEHSEEFHHFCFPFQFVCVGPSYRLARIVSTFILQRML
ncbi:hypothetical protein PSPHG_CDS_0155 [Pseudomonas phage Psxphi15]